MVARLICRKRGATHLHQRNNNAMVYLKITLFSISFVCCLSLEIELKAKK